MQQFTRRRNSAILAAAKNQDEGRARRDYTGGQQSPNQYSRSKMRLQYARGSRQENCKVALRRGTEEIAAEKHRKTEPYPGNLLRPLFNGHDFADLQGFPSAAKLNADALQSTDPFAARYDESPSAEDCAGRGHLRP